MDKQDLGYHCLSYATTGRSGDVVGGEADVVGGIRVGANAQTAIAGAFFIAVSTIALSWLRGFSKSGGE